MIEFEIEEGLAYEPQAAYSVNTELNLAWEIIEDTGANLFLTGRAGTGKTTFLKKLRESSSKRMVVLAPTGVAAINAAGATIHSFFQLPFSPFIPGKGFLSDDKKFLNINKQKKKLIASLSLLVIDEISMVRPDVLDAIDYILRRLRNSPYPFGGLQLLLIGDLRQLPPVVKDGEWQILKDYYPTPYFFESHALKQAGFQTIELSMVYRQSDTVFIEILNKIRDGKADASTLKELNKRYLPVDGTNNMDGYIRLTTHNHRASLINEYRLAELTSPEFVYDAEVEGIFPESAFPAEKFLRLKEGAQVMFVKNDIGTDRKYYNGLIGRVEGLTEEKVRVKLPSTGEVIDVEPAEWDNTRYVIDDVTKDVKQENIGTFRQYPLQLAWAITIHKSQGLTFDKAIIDATYSFAPGQTYVALSRCRSLDGLILDSPVPPRAMIIDKEVNDFVSYCEKNSPNEEKLEKLKDHYQYSLFLELFDFEPIRRNYQDFIRYALEYIASFHKDVEEKLYAYRDKLDKELCSVSSKFTGGWNAEKLAMELSAYNSNLKERIMKGASYFLEIIVDFDLFLGSLPVRHNNATFTERLSRTHESLIYQIKLKRKLLSSFSKVKFSTPIYVNAKTKAVMELEESTQSKGKQKFYSKTPRKKNHSFNSRQK